jgi:hypothetical protein
LLAGVVKKYPLTYSKLVVRLGGFHIAENFMGCIGHFMKEGGIEDIIVESGMCRRGTANKVISGKGYYKMVRCHSLISEAMVGLVWDAFEEWLLDNDRQDVLEFGESLDNVYEALQSKHAASALSSCVHVMAALEDLCPVWKEYVSTLGKTAQYWLMYVKIVGILKRFIQAERSGDWLGHLREVKNMLPYMVAAKHTNYMSCLPLYLKDMKELPEKHPVVYENFISGHFTVHRRAGRFNGTWTDMALEQTYNKEGKSSLFKKISQNPGAREKYIKTTPFLTKISQSIKDMAQLGERSIHHHWESQNTVVEDHNLVESVRKMIKEKIVNPFTTTNHDDLINIASGEEANSSEVIHAHKLGLAAFTKAEKEGSSKIVPPSITTFAKKKNLHLRRLKTW